MDDKPKKDKEDVTSIVKFAPIAIFSVDTNRRILSWNNKAQEITGYTAEEVIGKECTIFADEPCQNKCWLYSNDIEKPISGRVCHIKRKDGQLGITIKNADLLKDEKGNVIGGVESFEDIAGLRQTQEVIIKAAEEWRTTFDSINDLISIQDNDFKITRVNRAYSNAFKMKPQEVLGKTCYELFHGRKGPLPNCPHVKTMETKKPASAEFFDHRIKTYLEISTSPIFNKQGEIIGTVHIAKDITERKQARRDLQLSLEKLERLLNETSSALASAVEKRDPYTAGHQQRVAQLAWAIGHKMKVPADMLRGIHLAAIIHDIGKMYVPAELLSKPGKLSDIEFALIKTHSQVGYDILKTIEFQWPVAKIVLQHHERLDNSGYPQSLSAKEILLEAKILAVADVVEAMASHRPYRPALGIDKALYEISRKKDILYDVEVVDACLGLFNEEQFIFE